MIDLDSFNVFSYFVHFEKIYRKVMNGTCKL